MKDPIDVADEVFIVSLQVAQKLEQNEEFKHLSTVFKTLAEQLAEEVADSDPLHLLWAGATIQAIMEEILEAADEASGSDSILTQYLDEAHEKITISLFGEQLEEDNYGS